MTSFDFEKILADAGAELDQERLDRLNSAMNTAIEIVEIEAGPDGSAELRRPKWFVET